VAPVAVRVLLTRERPRYAEEYGSELWEIAQVGGYWWPGGCAHGAAGLRRRRAVIRAALAAGVACWLPGSDARTDRVSRVLLALAGRPRLPGPGGTAAPVPSAPAAAPVSGPGGRSRRYFPAGYAVATRLARSAGLPRRLGRRAVAERSEGARRTPAQQRGDVGPAP